MKTLIQFLFILFFAVQSYAAASVRLYFIDPFTGSKDTNVFYITPIGTNVLSNGGVVTKGIPSKVVPSADGNSTNTLAVGHYSVTNRSLGSGIVIRVPDTSTFYDYTNLLVSGYNIFVTIENGDGGAGANVTATGLAIPSTNGSTVTVNVPETNVIRVAQQQLASGTNTFSGSATLSSLTAASPLSVDFLGGTLNSGNSTMGASGFATLGGVLNPTGFYGLGIGITNATPALATNNATATDGMVLTKTGDKLKLATASGSGDVTAAIAANNILQKVYNIRDFGADGNDSIVGGDHIALQNAIDAASTNLQGGIVYIPSGTYYLSNVSYKPTFTSENHQSLIVILSNNITIRGAGRDSTKIKFQNEPGGVGAAGQFLNGFGGGDNYGTPYHGPTNLTFEHITIDANVDNQSYAYDTTQIYNSEKTFYKNLRFINTREDAIDNMGTVNVENCEFINIGNSVCNPSSESLYRNCYITNAGFLATDGGDIIGVNGGKATFDNIYIYGGSGKIFCKNGTAYFANSTFVDCYFTNANANSIYLENCDISATTTPAWSAFNWTGGALSVVNSRFTRIRPFSVTNINGLFFIGNNAYLPTSVTLFSSVDGIVAGSPFQIVNNNFIGGSGTRIEILSTANRGDGALVSGNVFNLADFRMGTSSTNAIITGNTFYAGQLRIFGGGYHTIANNYFNPASAFDADCSHSLINGNMFAGAIRIGIAATGLNNKYLNNIFPTAGITGSGPTYTNQNYFDGNFAMDSVLPVYDGPRVYTTSSTVADYDKTVVFNGSSITCTLPTAVGRMGKSWTIKNVHSTALTIATTSSQTVDGAAPATQAQWVSRTYVSDGANWILR